MKSIYEKTERKNFGKDQQDAWAARTDMFEAIAKLQALVEKEEGK